MGRNTRPARLIAPAMALWVCAATAASCEKQIEATSTVVRVEPAGFEIVAPSDEWISIDEQGVSLRIESDARGVRIPIGVPPRYARTFVQARAGQVIRIRRSESGRSLARAKVERWCSDEGWESRKTWWLAASSLAETVAHPLSDNEASFVRDQAFILRTGAFDGFSRALAMHLSAQGWMQAGRFARATVEFEQAAEYWRQAGDSAREAAAKVGHAESLVASGRYAAALAYVPTGRSWRKGYYATRLHNSRCLSLHYMNRLAAASACYGQYIDELARLDERLERANALRNQAEVLLATGNLSGAESAATKALDLPKGANAAMVRGRSRLTLANAAIARGDVQSAIGATALALGDFADARARAWQGDAMLKAARIFRELAATDDAYLSVRDALKMYSSDEPALIAAALTVYAEIERGSRRYSEAGYAAAQAARIYGKLNMPAERERAQLILADVMLKTANVDGAERLLSGNSTNRSNLAARMLVEADVAVERGSFARARARLASAKAGVLGFSQTIQAARIEASIWHDLGNAARASHALQSALRGVERLARSSRNRLLRRMLSHESRELRQAGLSYALEDIGEGAVLEDSKAESLWQWVEVAAPDWEGTEPLRSAGELDGAIAAELLGPASQSASPRSRARRHLLEVLSKRSDGSADRPGVARISLAQVRRSLRPNEALLAYLDGGDAAALLYATSTRISVHRVSGPAIKREVDELNRLAASASSQAADIRDAAKHLSNLVFGDAPSLDPPLRLLVVADTLLDAVAWTLLQWPGHDEELVATTTPSIVRFTRERQRSVDAIQTRLHVLAPQEVQGEQSSLIVAGTEPALIRSATIGSPLGALEVDEPTPKRFLIDVAESHAWVHVAAHGFVRPGRLGYSGIWFNRHTDTGSALESFLSWFDVLANGVNADLVVLDSCSLGGPGEKVGTSLGFASAVSEGGAHYVIAFSWSASDAAAGLWVPTFYRSLVADPAGDVGAAIRVAQQRLRNSRAFRHPYYWAGIQLFERLSIAESPAIGGGADTKRAPRRASTPP